MFISDHCVAEPFLCVFKLCNQLTEKAIADCFKVEKDLSACVQKVTIFYYVNKLKQIAQNSCILTTKHDL